jgi:catechol 2,3-dioxygenase-like lactoylglutathione lyase family enzyme
MSSVLSSSLCPEVVGLPPAERAAQRPRPWRPAGAAGGETRRAGNSDLCFVWQGTIDGAVEHLRLHEVEILEGPVTRQGFDGERTSVYFRDPDGALIEFIAYRTGSTSPMQ